VTDRPTASSGDLKDALNRLRAFRRGDSAEKLFVHPTGHPARDTGFCYCEGSWWKALRFHLKAILLCGAFKLPSNSLKIRVLRWFGAQVGKDVYFSPSVWIDPTYPELITIEDEVFFGMGVKLFNHEYRVDEFRAGRILIRRRAFVGAFATIPCGTEIGAGAVVSAFAVVHCDVPAGAAFILRPGKLILNPHANPGDDDRGQSE
jgi:acetyltransferase-like isoleucine patch superfamily enzyme